MTDLDLAEEFRLLAEDETWPIGLVYNQFHHDWSITSRAIKDAGNSVMAVFSEDKEQWAKEFADSPLRRAQLALMVVRKESSLWMRVNDEHWNDPEWKPIDDARASAIKALNINPSDYANVKERVEAAK